MEIKTFSPTSHKIKAVVYGASGSGKTYFAASAPDVIFASAEAGLLSTIGYDKPIRYKEITSVEDLRELLKYLQNNKHDFKTVVIDSISEINEIIKEGIEKKRGAQMIQKDWGDLFKAIKGILRGFRDLDMHVIFIAQEKVEKDDQKTEKIVPMLNGKAATEIAYFMDIVAYCYIDKMGEHKILVQPSEKYLTKCRGIDLPAEAPLDFNEWIAAMEKIKLKKEKVEVVDVKSKNEVLPADNLLHIQNDTSKLLFAKWDKFIELSGKNKKQSVDILKATLKKEYNKESTRELTEEEAKQFVEKLESTNKRLKAEAKKESSNDQEQKPEDVKPEDSTSTPQQATISQ